MTDKEISDLIDQKIQDEKQQSQYGVSRVPVHTHNNLDSPSLSFIGLGDAPPSYQGQAGKVPTVNSIETGLVFTSPSSSAAGSTGDIQFNTGGAFDASSELTFSNSGAVKTLEVNDGTSYGQLTQDGLRTGTVGNAYSSFYGDYSYGFNSTSTNSDFFTRYSTVKTTNATPTTIDSIFYTTTQSNFIEARVVGRRTGGTSGSAGDSAAYIIRAIYEGGTIIGSISVDFIQESQPAWDATFSVGVGIINIVVTGAANNNVTWSCYVTSQEIAN